MYGCAVFFLELSPRPRYCGAMKCLGSLRVLAMARSRTPGRSAKDALDAQYSDNTYLQLCHGYAHRGCHRPFCGYAHCLRDLKLPLLRQPHKKHDWHYSFFIFIGQNYDASPFETGSYHPRTLLDIYIRRMLQDGLGSQMPDRVWGYRFVYEFASDNRMIPRTVSVDFGLSDILSRLGTVFRSSARVGFALKEDSALSHAAYLDAISARARDLQSIPRSLADRDEDWAADDLWPIQISRYLSIEAVTPEANLPYGARPPHANGVAAMD